ncbi:MAG: YciC family protein [Patescibacteria group bacterium]
MMSHRYLFVPIVSLFLATTVNAQAFPQQEFLSQFAGQPQQVVIPPSAPNALVFGILGGVALLWVLWAVFLLLSIFKKMNHIPREKLLGEAWSLTLKNKKVVVLMFLAQFFLSLTPALIQWFLRGTLGVTNQYLFNGVGVLFQVVNLLASLWILHTLLELSKGKEVKRFEFSFTPSQIFSFLGAAFITTLATILGLALLIIPGIIIATALSFFPLFILEKHEKPLQALKSSIALTKGTRFELFLMYFLLLVLNIVGFSAFIVGLFVTLPLTAFVWIGMGRSLESRKILRQ